MCSKRWASKLVWIAVLALTAGCSGGRPPSNLGVTEGRLAPCPGSPNCVSSEATNEQRVEPLRYDGDAAPARARLLDALNGMERARIVQSTGDYIHAEFRSAIFGFVDDVEFYFSPPGTIQVRSAARTGYYDFGVNRKRVETLRARFAATPEAGGTVSVPLNEGGDIGDHMPVAHEAFEINLFDRRDGIHRRCLTSDQPEHHGQDQFAECPLTASHPGCDAV